MILLLRSSHSFSWIVIAILVAALAACGSNRPSAGGITKVLDTGQKLPPPDVVSAAGEFEGVSEYRLGAQDLLEISVFQVEDLNREVRINSGGQISLPLVGTFRAGGMTVQQLEAEIARKLDEGFLQNPQVTVFVKEFASQKITMEGEIAAPGVYPLTGKTTLLQAVAMGRGLGPLADPRGIVVFRVIEGQKMAAVFDLKAIRTGDAEDPQIYGNDVIVVDTSGPKAALRRITESAQAFNIFRIY